MLWNITRLQPFCRPADRVGNEARARFRLRLLRKESLHPV